MATLEKPRPKQKKKKEKKVKPPELEDFVTVGEDPVPACSSVSDEMCSGTYNLSETESVEDTFVKIKTESIENPFDGNSVKLSDDSYQAEVPLKQNVSSEKNIEKSLTSSECSTVKEENVISSSKVDIESEKSKSSVTINKYSVNYNIKNELEEASSESPSATAMSKTSESLKSQSVVIEGDKRLDTASTELKSEYDKIKEGAKQDTVEVTVDEEKHETKELKQKTAEYPTKVLEQMKASTVPPSAPLLDSAIVKKVTVKEKKPDVKSLENIQKPFEIQDLKTMKPFTEVQLASLYHNPEIEAAAQFINGFVESELKCDFAKQHHLYDLLVNYLRARTKLTSNTLEINNLRTESKEIQALMWTLERATIAENGECEDGNTVTTSHEYRVARFHKNVLHKLTKFLSKIKELTNEVHALHSYSAEVSKLQVEVYIQTVISNCLNSAKLTHNAPVCLQESTVDPYIQRHLQELRLCITILFTFQRRPLRDTQFVADTRSWLRRLIGVLLRLSTWQDHLFLLNHVLRCPAGISTWAIEFIQIPCSQSFVSPFLNLEINHSIAVLATILMPVHQRDAFLEQIQKSLQESRDLVEENLWVLVDSDGEEDEEPGSNELRENDLVAVLNQIPFDNIFRNILLIQRRDEEDFYDASAITEHHVLRLFAWSTIWVRLLRQGLSTYSTPRYRQLAKRLGRLVRHTVQYVSDVWEHFKNTYSLNDTAMVKRLQIEYDAFFMRATQCIFSSQKLGAWQFLAVIPYNVVSIHTLWRIFYLLHEGCNELELILDPSDKTDFKEKLLEPSLRHQFEDRLISMPEAESYYLLQTFANMALARSDDDKMFIRTATIDLLQVGFLSTATQDSCSKSARVLLASITAKHPELLSDILITLGENFNNASQLSVYLFKELPLYLWKPSEVDMEIVSNWLLHGPLGSPESNLARLILGHLNWDFDSDGSLFLPHDIHFRVAVLIIVVAFKYTPEYLSTTSASMITDSVKTVSAMVRPSTNEQAFTLWAWEMVLRLRLHVLDQGETMIYNALTNIGTALRHVPELESIDAIQAGVKEKQPLACFVAIMLTLWGHSVPLICSKGLQQLTVLQCFYKHDVVLIALNRLVPMFLDCEDSLVKSETFISVIVSLLNADRTYLKMAKNLISAEFPGTILKQFSNLIQYHLDNYQNFSLSSPRPFVSLWMKCITKIPDWSKDPSAVYLLNTIMRSSFFNAESNAVAVDFLRNLLQHIPSSRQQTSTLSNFITWVSSGAGAGTIATTLLPRGSLPESPWYVYTTLELEHTELELRTGLWKEILRQLSISKGKASVDNAIKKAAAIVKVPAFSSSFLCIFRWAQQALDTPLGHPLLPLIWQKFFILFLARAPSAPGQTDRGGVGNKFFEGMINLGFHKKLKKRLQDTIEFYKKKTEIDLVSNDSETRERRKLFFTELTKLFRTFSLWLEETRLHETGLFLQALPPQYDSHKLALIFQGNTNPWLDYLDYDQVKEEKSSIMIEWNKLCFRFRSPPATPVHLRPNAESADPTLRIVRRLSSYDTPQMAPPIRPAAPVIPHLKCDVMYDKDVMLAALKPYIKTILEFAQNYSMRVSEHTALDCAIVELAPQLYRSVQKTVTLRAACHQTYTDRRTGQSQASVQCSGPAVIKMKISEAQINESIEHQVVTNRNDYEVLLNKALQTPPQSLCSGCVFLEHTVTILQSESVHLRSRNDAQAMKKLQKVAVEFFYHILSLIKEETNFYPPTKQLFTTCVEKLGQSFIYGWEEEGERLLEMIIKRPNLVGILAPHLSPAALSGSQKIGAASFLNMYAMLVDRAIGLPDVGFVVLSKFDVNQWLHTHKPKLSERSKFITLVCKALTTIGLEPAAENLMLHEVFRKHLVQIFCYEFPEHYGEVLTLLLRGSEQQSLAVDVWFDILQVLASGKKFKPGQPHCKLRDDLRLYATHQNMLKHNELLETATLLGRHFTQERFQYGLYGLYPRYRPYIEPLSTLMAMIAHAFVISTMQIHRGYLADKLCETMWPALSEMFSPWLAPYWNQNSKDSSAVWIQQLTDDRSVLPPWIAADGPRAQYVVNLFTECVRFIIDTLPACINILSFVWQYYASNFAHSAVKSHVLGAMHAGLLSLQWEKFWPSLQDLELMLKVADQYLPDCHAMVGNIFIRIKWSDWLKPAINSPPPTPMRAHHCVLHLLVKLANEPTVRMSDQIKPLLLEALNFGWCLVDASTYEQVVNWYVMSGDPRVVLRLAGQKEDRNEIDQLVLDLLQSAAEIYPINSKVSQEATLKRQIFVKGYIKLLTSCASRNKPLLSTNEYQFRNAIIRILDSLEAVLVTAPVDPGEGLKESPPLMFEVLSVCNLPHDSPLLKIAVDTIVNWIGEHDTNSLVLRGSLKVFATVPTCPNALGNILEATILGYFKFNVGQQTPPTWKQLFSQMQALAPRQRPICDTFVADGNILSLYTEVNLRLPACHDIVQEGVLLQSLIDWIAAIKPSESVEPKLPLLYSLALQLSLRQCLYSSDHRIASFSLRTLASALTVLAEDKGSGWGILGAIGIRKQPNISNRCRLICRALSAYIYVQLPDCRPEEPKIRYTENAPGGFGQPGCSPDAVKAVHTLENMLNSKSYGELKVCAELALKQVQNPGNSLHNAQNILSGLTSQLYTQPYLSSLID